METLSPTATGSVWRDLSALARYRITHIDRPAWRRFFLALFGLALAFFLALYAVALRETGQLLLAAWTSGSALIIAGIVGVKVVPYLARRTALERWLIKIEYEFTREGAVYLLTIGIIAIAALNTGNNLLYIILASLLAGILASGILSKIVLSELELEFQLPDHVFAARPIISRVSVRNLKWVFPSFSITVSARRPEGPTNRWIPSGALGRRASQKPADAHRRKRGRAAPAHPSTEAILEQPVYIPYIPHRAVVAQHVELTFPRRGRYTQEGFRVSSKFPFGFLRKTHDVPSRQEIVVLPDVQPTEEFFEILPLIAGEVESFFKGRGHDLYSIRDYQESDPARHVDWKASAKSQQLKVREFTREDERRLVLAFDALLPDETEAALGKFEKGVTLCACLAWHFYEIGAQMKFVTNDHETPMAPSASIIYPVLETLALIEPKSRSPAGDFLTHLASSRMGFNIILTSRARGTIPTFLWGSSYLIFIDSL